jgi:hypothetical protein
MIKIFYWIFGRKKAKQNYPPEFAVITLSDTAKRNGIDDLQNKLIIRYKHNYRTDRIEIYRVYGYSDSLIFNLRNKLKIPVYDETIREEQYPTYGDVDLSEVEYDKG